MPAVRPSSPSPPSRSAAERRGRAPAKVMKLMKSPKAKSAAECRALEQLPNIGPSLAADLRLIGIHAPADLLGQDAFALYRKLCTATGARQDPCVLDTFMAVTDFMRGAPAAPWWHYTAQRKSLFGVV